MAPLQFTPSIKMLCAAFNHASADTHKVYGTIFRTIVLLVVQRGISSRTFGLNGELLLSPQSKTAPIYKLGHGGGEKKTLSMGEAAVKVISVSRLIFVLPQELRSIK